MAVVVAVAVTSATQPLTANSIRFISMQFHWSRPINCEPAIIQKYIRPVDVGTLQPQHSATPGHSSQHRAAPAQCHPRAFIPRPEFY